MRKAIIYTALAVFLFVSCQKNSQTVQSKPIDLFFRLSMVGSDNQVSYSQIVSTKSTTLGGEVIGDNNPGNGNGHYDGDGCDEGKPDFCQKHPWHKKCQILGMKLEYFSLVNDEKVITVNWKAIDETTISKYVLQRSTDAVDFKDIYTIGPKGTNVRYSYKETVK